MLRSCIILSLAFSLVSLSGNTMALDAVVLELKSGKRLRAHAIETDPKAPDRVILMLGNDKIQMRRSVAWDNVKTLSVSPELKANLQIPPDVNVIDPQNPNRHELTLNLSTDQADQNAASLRSFFRYPPPPPAPDPSLTSPIDGPFPGFECGPPPGWFFIRDPGVVVGVRYENPMMAPPPDFAVPGAMAPTIVLPADQPRELIVSARAFNRNGLADWNSLEVSIQGRTASGLTCPVRGSLKCTLWARNSRLVRAYADTFFLEPRDIVRVGVWSQFIDGSELDANGVQKIILAMPQRSADQNLMLSDVGLLSVDLDIPGQGRLATSSDPVLLRQGGAIRSRSVVDFGSSILPPESASEGVFGSGDWPGSLSSIRPDSRRFTIQP